MAQADGWIDATVGWLGPKGIDRMLPSGSWNDATRAPRVSCRPRREPLATAHDELARARELNPGEAVVAEAPARLAAGRTLDPAALEAGLADRQTARLSPTG